MNLDISSEKQNGQLFFNYVTSLKSNGKICKGN